MKVTLKVRPGPTGIGPLGPSQIPLIERLLAPARAPDEAADDVGDTLVSVCGSLVMGTCHWSCRLLRGEVSRLTTSMEPRFPFCPLLQPVTVPLIVADATLIVAPAGNLV